MFVSVAAGVSRAAISADELAKIVKAVPKKATVKPKKPRRMLVFAKGKGHVHTAIPYGTKALGLMAEKTGAFEIVVTTDMAVFRPEVLKSFDAICFNNSNRMDFSDPAKRKAVMDFVRSGKGVVGIHAATTNFTSKRPVGSVDWPEGAAMLGGIFAGHPWRSGKGEWAVKIDDPGHPLTAAFRGKGFKVADEIYVCSNFQADDLRILLSLDFADPKTGALKGNHKSAPISWIRDWGKGRVFYCSFGHDHDIFWNAPILQHLLDGIQFALGDLPADTTPTPRLNPELRKAEQHAVITEDWGRLNWLAGRNIGNAQGLVLGRVTIKSGKTNPRHRHPKSEEVLYLLKGSLKHTLGDRTIIMHAGDTITIAPGIFHNAGCISTDDADMIVVYSEGIRKFEVEQ